ncbi:hypothetical protein ACK3TF_001099 [Chlorella vulgaris]
MLNATTQQRLQAQKETDATTARKEKAARTKINQGMSLRNLLEKSPYVGQINLKDGVALSPNPEHHVGCSDEMKATLLPLMPKARATMAGLWEKDYEPVGITTSMWHDTPVEYNGELMTKAQAAGKKAGNTKTTKQVEHNGELMTKAQAAGEPAVCGRCRQAGAAAARLAVPHFNAAVNCSQHPAHPPLHVAHLCAGVQARRRQSL